MDKNRLRLCVSAGDFSTATEEWSWYFAYCNFNTSGVKSFADDLAVRNGPVSSRVALLLRSAEGKPSFASISPVRAPSRRALVGDAREQTSQRRLGAPAWRAAESYRVGQVVLVPCRHHGSHAALCYRVGTVECSEGKLRYLREV